MKNYLVTGGSNGIGKAVVDALIQTKGNKVYNLDIAYPDDFCKKACHSGLDPESPSRNQEILNQVQDDSLATQYSHISQSNQDSVSFIKVDLSNQQQVEQAISQLKDIQFDGIFLNAGILIKGSIFDISIEDIKKVLDINVWSIIHIIKGLQHNLKTGSSIVLSGSDQCFVAKTNSFAYTMSKGAIAQITKSLAVDLAQYQIRVNTICPGTVDTELYRGIIQKYADRVGISFEQAHQQECQEFPLNTIAQPKEIADLVLYLLSDKSRFMTGSLIPIDGGYTAR